MHAGTHTHTHKLELPYPQDYIPPRRQKLTNESPSARHGTPLRALLVKSILKIPKTVQAIIIDLGCTPEIHGETAAERTVHFGHWLQRKSSWYL